MWWRADAEMTKGRWRNEVTAAVVFVDVGVGRGDQRGTRILRALEPLRDGV